MADDGIRYPDEQDPVENMPHILLWGNLENGYKAFGPFASYGALMLFVAHHELPDDYWQCIVLLPGVELINFLDIGI